MARKDQLRGQRYGTVINTTSKKQETDVIKALQIVIDNITRKYGELPLSHEKQWLLKDIVGDLKIAFPDVEFDFHFNSSSIRPDGGILYIHNVHNGAFYPILISEAKNQGTNDLRIKEGLNKQAKGNAIERLGKNLIGLRTALLKESIFPFVCFGYGCDFAPDSSILDRVTTMAMFGKINKTYLYNEEAGRFNRGSFYFRQNKWSVDEMASIMTDIAERSILYYFSKYSEQSFLKKKSN